MTNITLTIETHGGSRTISLTHLAMLIGLPPDQILRRFSFFFGTDFDSKDDLPVRSEQVIHNTDGSSEEGGTIGGKVNVSEYKYISNVFGGERGSLREETPRRPVDEPLAQELAETLRDQHSLPYLRSLTVQYSRTMLIEALNVTLRVPRERIARRPAAYFMGVLRNISKDAIRD